jgi:hypothetical protein
MKRSRMFLGLTTGALAIAGAVAVKASNFGGQTAYYVTSGPSATCITDQAGCIFNPAGVQTCKTAGATAKYFTSRTTNQHCNLLKPLKYTVL